MMKLLAKKRLIVIAVIVAVLVGLFTYAQYKQSLERQEKLGTTDWRASVQTSIIDITNRLSSSGMSDDTRERMQITLKQQQYYLDHDINPSEPGAPTFMRIFIENSGMMLIPLLVIVIASDLVSSEHTLGSIKLLLTRPVQRWRILVSKYISLLLAISIIMAIVGILSFLLSGIVFGYKGMDAPVITGFSAQAGNLDISRVRMISQWKFLLMDFGLAWFVAVVVGTLSFMLSVLIRSTAAGMGIMLGCPRFRFHFKYNGFIMGICQIFIYGQFKSNWIFKWNRSTHRRDDLTLFNKRLGRVVAFSPPYILLCFYKAGCLLKK